MMNMTTYIHFFSPAPHQLFPSELQFPKAEFIKIKVQKNSFFTSYGAPRTLHQKLGSLRVQNLSYS